MGIDLTNELLRFIKMWKVVIDKPEARKSRGLLKPKFGVLLGKLHKIKKYNRR